MPPLGTFRKKTCAKCFKCLKVHLTCSKCDALYHAKCLLKVTGFHMDQNGHAFCCQNITFKSDPDKEILVSQENVVTVKREKEYDSDKDLEKCLPHEDGSTGNKFKCEACYLEFTNEEHLERHYRECLYIMQGEPIQEINTDGLVCPFCNEENIREDSYKEHIKQCEEHHSRLTKVNDIPITTMKGKRANAHRNERLFKCNKCDYATKRRYFLIYHILSKHYDGRKWSTHVEYTLERHLRSHTNQKLFKCNRCDYRTALKGSLKSHMKVTHSERSHILGKHRNPDNKYKCSHCKYSTNKKSSIVMHLRIHTDERPFKCDTCTYAVATKSCLKDHILAKHFDVEKKYKCNDCEYSAHRKSALVKHMRTHERPFKCDICSYAAAREINLNSHILAKHSHAEKKYKCSDCEFSAHLEGILAKHTRMHERPFRCSTCHYVANRSEDLNDHILARHSNAGKKHKCSYCKYSTQRRSNLTKHVLIHTNERPFKCDICDYAATRKSSLDVHVSAIHSNAEKKYKCADCTYSTHQKSSLVRHIRSHTNERPFKCDTCNYAANAKSHLNDHILAKHSNAEKKYKCGECEYSTHHKPYLVRHARTHLNERPFKCDTCNYAASSKSHLNDHILATHSNAEITYKCSKCEYSTHHKPYLVRHLRIHINKKPL